MDKKDLQSKEHWSLKWARYSCWAMQGVFVLIGLSSLTYAMCGFVVPDFGMVLDGGVGTLCVVVVYVLWKLVMERMGVRFS